MSKIKVIIIALIFFVFGLAIGAFLQPRILPNLGKINNAIVNKDSGQTYQVNAADNTKNKESDTKNENKVNIILFFGENNVKSFNDLTFAEGQTLFDLTKNVTAGNGLAFEYDPPAKYGVFVKQIGDKKNGEDKKFWQFWVGDAQPPVAADQYQLKNGDIITWKFIESKF